MIRMQDVGSLYLADKAPILYIHKYKTMQLLHEEPLKYW